MKTNASFLLARLGPDLLAKRWQPSTSVSKTPSKTSVRLLTCRRRVGDNGPGNNASNDESMHLDQSGLRLPDQIFRMDPRREIASASFPWITRRQEPDQSDSGISRRADNPLLVATGPVGRLVSVAHLELRSKNYACRFRRNPEYFSMKVNVVVTPKAAVLDPQGAAVRDAMQHLGMPEVRSVRIGKYLEIDIDEKAPDVESRLQRFAAICFRIP